jgi:hypothetical protein
MAFGFANGSKAVADGDFVRQSFGRICPQVIDIPAMEA